MFNGSPGNIYMELTFWEVDILGVDFLGVDILGRTLLCQCSLSLIHSMGYKKSHSQLGEGRIELCLISFVTWPLYVFLNFTAYIILSMLRFPGLHLWVKSWHHNKVILLILKYKCFIFWYLQTILAVWKDYAHMITGLECGMLLAHHQCSLAKPDSRTKVIVWLRKTMVMKLSLWPKMWWQELVFDPQSLHQCIDSIEAILSMVCVPRPLVTPIGFTTL